MANGSDGIGEVATRTFEFGSAAEPFALQNGDKLPGVTLAYEIYGELNAAKDNAILLFHALSGSHHAAGINRELPAAGDRWTQECQVGWWDGFIGPGKALDTDQFCVICINYLGGCYGSTGPSSIDPETGLPYGSKFPAISITDIVETQVRLLDHLGIAKLHAVIGGSVGGMLCVSFALRYPERVATVIPIATGWRVSALQRIHNFEQIYAIESDRNFRGGDYYDGEAPDRGLGLARMISHKTYVSLSTLERRARREVLHPLEAQGWYRLTSTLESYMLHQSQKFVKRFDANTYLRIMQAWQDFDLLHETGVEDVVSLLSPCQHQNYLIFSISSDVCFYPEEQVAMVEALKRADVPNMHITVHSEKGHDSFLLEPELYTPHLHYALQGNLT